MWCDTAAVKWIRWRAALYDKHPASSSSFRCSLCSAKHSQLNAGPRESALGFLSSSVWFMSLESTRDPSRARFNVRVRGVTGASLRSARLCSYRSSFIYLSEYSSLCGRALSVSLIVHKSYSQHHHLAHKHKPALPLQGAKWAHVHKCAAHGTFTPQRGIGPRVSSWALMPLSHGAAA